MPTATLTRPSRPTQKKRNVMERASGVIGRIDRERGIIRGVKVLGRVSKNGHTYTDAALRKGRPLYEGARVYVDHPPDRNATAERSVSDLAGVMENVVMRSDGLYGDLHLLKSHPRFDSIMEIAERKPNLIGLSHNAVITESTHNGNVVFDGIERVRSVDLVTQPATTRGIFEGADDDDDYMPDADTDPSSPGVAPPGSRKPGTLDLSDSGDAIFTYIAAKIEGVLTSDISTDQKISRISRLVEKYDEMMEGMAEVSDAAMESHRERRRLARGKNALESGRRLPKNHAELKSVTSTLLAPLPTTGRRGNRAVGAPRNHAELVQATREIMRHR